MACNLFTETFKVAMIFIKPPRLEDGTLIPIDPELKKDVKFHLISILVSFITLIVSLVLFVLDFFKVG